jgi:nucleotide-binding universal stress UspA family protein
MALYVKRAASIFGSKVTLVYVCDPSSNNSLGLYVRTPTEVTEEHVAVAQEKLASFPGIRLSINNLPENCVLGRIGIAIAEVVRDESFDLVIMPTHASRFRRMLFGSTTAKLLHDSEAPVLTVENVEAKVPKPLDHRVEGLRLES